LCERYSGPIHLLLTDVVLAAQLSGRELVQHLAPLRREMKVLYMSGYSDEAIVHHGVLEPGTAFLQKPFTTESLMRKLREVLDQKKTR
jgi:FixJ family two-component response regulator